MKKKEKKDKSSKRTGIRMIRIDHTNIDFLKKICSKSGYGWHEMYYLNANKYYTCLRIHEFPEQSSIKMINELNNIENVMVTVDGENISPVDYDKKIEKVINKEYDKQDETKKITSFRRSSENIKELMQFDKYIVDSKETVKEITVRIYVFGNTYEELQDRVQRLDNVLRRKKMRGYIHTNDMTSDVKALTSFDNAEKTMVASSTVAEMMMRSEINMVDDNMGLIGYTNNGLFAPNPFLFSFTSYCKAFLGKTGSGKSALFKRMFECLYIRGNHIQYIFDIHGEYKDICKKLGISIVSISEKNYINYSQIFYTENSNGIISEVDIINKISSMTSIFISVNSLNLNRDNTIIKQYKKFLRDALLPYIGKSINELSNDDWFTLDTILNNIKADQEVERIRYEKEKEDIYTLMLCLEEMIHEYGVLFNHKTNMNFDLENSLCFDFSFLLNNDNKIIKTAYVELFLNYVSYGFYLNKKRNEEEMKKRKIDLSELVEPLFTLDCAIDEFMTFAVSRSFLERCVDLIKYARKAYCGFSFMIHTTSDLTKGYENNGDLLVEIFGLSVHKYIGEIDGTSLDTLKSLVPCLNERDLLIISKFKKGADGARSFMAIINDAIKIPFNSIVTPFQSSYYGGGK